MNSQFTARFKLLLCGLLLGLGSLSLAGCQPKPKEATADALTAPLPTPTPPPPPKIDPARTDLERVQVGSLAPDFALEDQIGHQVRLSDFRNKKFVTLVFYRGHF